MKRLSDKICTLTKRRNKSKKGEAIIDGKIIVLSDMTGGATGPHLHLAST